MSESLNKLFTFVLVKNPDVKCITLSTEDGFTIACQHADDFFPEAEKMSAVTTSLAALSNSASMQMINSELIRTVIETNHGDLFIYRTTYLEKNTVMSLITARKSNHAKSRFISNDLVKTIEKLSS